MILKVGCYISGQLSLDIIKPGLKGIIILSEKVGSVNLINHPSYPTTDRGISPLVSNHGLSNLGYTSIDSDSCQHELIQVSISSQRWGCRRGGSGTSFDVGSNLPIGTTPTYNHCIYAVKSTTGSLNRQGVGPIILAVVSIYPPHTRAYQNVHVIHSICHNLKISGWVREYSICNEGSEVLSKLLGRVYPVILTTHKLGIKESTCEGHVVSLLSF